MLVKSSPSALDMNPTPGPSNEPIPPLAPPSYKSIFQSDESETSTHLGLYQQKMFSSSEMRSDGRGDTDDNQSYPPVKKKEWHQRAKGFVKTGHEAKRGVLREVGDLVHLVVSIPCLVVGTALHIVGGTVHAAASAVEGMGDAISGGSRSPRDADGGPRIGRGNDGFQGKRRS